MLDDALDEESATHNRIHVPAAKRSEIDAVLSRLPRLGPRIDPDPDIAVDETLIHADEGFYDEGMDTHHQIFIDTTARLRSRRKPYCRSRAPDSEMHSLVQRGVVQKTIRRRKRPPKADALGLESPSVASSPGFASGPPSAASLTSSTL